MWKIHSDKDITNLKQRRYTCVIARIKRDKAITQLPRPYRLIIPLLMRRGETGLCNPPIKFLPGMTWPKKNYFYVNQNTKCIINHPKTFVFIFRRNVSFNGANRRIYFYGIVIVSLWFICILIALFKKACRVPILIKVF